MGERRGQRLPGGEGTDGGGGRMKSVPGVAGRELGDPVQGAVRRRRSWQSAETIQRDRREREPGNHNVPPLGSLAKEPGGK